MTAIAISASGVAITMLYNTAVEQQTTRLSETAQSQARLLEAVARFDARFSTEDVPGGAFAATLQQIKEAHELFKGFGDTGEFTLAKREGEQMIYLLSRRLLNIETSANIQAPLSVPMEGPLAQPMQEALAGNSGTIIGLDYRGIKVLAAFEPVAELDLGIVAKIDLAEIRKPFLNAGFLVALVTLVLVAVGTFLVRRIGNPLIQQLEENEQRLRCILDTAADGIITQDEQGVIKSFNQAAEYIFGYSSDEVIGQNIASLIIEPYRYPQLRNDRRSEELFIGNEREVTALHKDGRRVPVEITVSEVQERKAWLVTSIVRDITERKQSLMALHQREEELRLTFENAPVGIYICTIEGHILRANHAFCMLLSYPELALLDKPYTDLIHADDLQEAYEQAHQLLAGERDSCSQTVNLVDKQGEKIPCMLRGSVIHDEQGSPRLCVVHIEDRSEQLKTEQLIREHRERLAHVTRLSTMGEMVASIAHEINQPLSAIATYAAACRRLIDQDEPVLDEVSQTLRKIRTQALRAGDVIHRLREFIRNRKTNSQLLGCHDLITEVIGFVELDAHYHHVVIHKELEPDLPLIHVDPVQIQQVIINLLRNAIESMEKVSALQNKEIRLQVKRHGHDAISILVIDRGSGLSAESEAQLFAPFFTTKPLGMGLGLSISRSIINAHGGTLDYTMNPEGGSIFQFTLPLNAKE